MPKRRQRRSLGSGALVRWRQRAAKSYWTPVVVLGGFAAFIGLYSWYVGGVPLMTKVYKKDRAAGTVPDLLGFLDWWDKNGPFPIVVGWMGGVRYPKDQAALYAKGRTVPGEPPFTEEKPLGRTVTNAATAEKSGHGHAAALDLYPATELGKALMDGDTNPETRQKQLTIGQKAKEYAASKGIAIVYGGDWRSPDYPHIELANWASLPLARDPATALV